MPIAAMKRHLRICMFIIMKIAGEKMERAPACSATLPDLWKHRKSATFYGDKIQTNELKSYFAVATNTNATQGYDQDQREEDMHGYDW